MVMYQCSHKEKDTDQSNLNEQNKMVKQVVWDTLITGGVLGSIVLFVWSRVTKMTIPELLREAKEFFVGGAEDITTEAMVWNE